VVVHEMMHSLVARGFGLRMRGITLFIFGGVAEMESEPPSAKAEFYMSLAGPATSFALGALSFAVYLVGRRAGWPIGVQGVLAYLAWINVILGAFNLVPAFPLDGGRVLRSALWNWKRDLGWATRVASNIGSGFGVAMIVLGVIYFIMGAFIAGIWWALIGLFIQKASQQSYRRMVVLRALQGETLGRIMKHDAVTVPPHTTLSDLVENYIYRHHHKMYPVVDDGRLVGCVTTGNVRDVPRDQWERRTVGEIAKPCPYADAVHPSTDAATVLNLMGRTGLTKVVVTDGERLVGVIGLRDIMQFLAAKMDLGGNEPDDQTDA